MKTTVGQILVNAALPPALRDYNRVIDKKSIKEVLQRVAEDYPDQYAQVVQKLNHIGRLVATYYGGPASIGTNDLRQSPELRARMRKIRQRVREIVRKTPPEKRTDALVKYLTSVADDLRKINLETGLRDDNAFAMQIVSGSRGNPTQFGSLRFGKLIVVDQNQKPLPIPVLHGFGEGLTPAEMWVNTYGARMGEVVKKEATPKAGFLGKQMALAAHKLIVTEKDCGSGGLAVKTDDKDNVGAVLAKTYGPFKAGTVLTPKIINRLKKTYDEILVRSPITCNADGGVCQKCAGIREGKWPAIGDSIDFVGITAANAIAEPVAQSQICLHKDTKVLMGDWSVKRICMIRPGEYVMGATPTGYYYPTKVVRAYYNGPQECYIYTFKYGRTKNGGGPSTTVTCTPSHKFSMRIRNSRTADVSYEIRPIERAVKRSRFVHASAFMGEGEDVRFARLLGVIAACGRCVDNRLYLRLNHDNEAISAVEADLSKMGVSFEVDDNVIDVDLISNPPMMGLLKFHFDNPEGLRLRTWSTHSIIQFMSGLYMARGSIVQRSRDQAIRVVLYMPEHNAKLAEELAWTLMHRLEICAVPRLHEGKRKDRILLYISQHNSVRNFFTLVRMYGERAERKLDVLRKQQDSQKRVEYGWMLYSQEPVGLQPTCDLEVESEHHLFVLANGLIVSNSAKHTAGAMGSTGAISGLSGINQFVQVPKQFSGAATLATVDGRVSSIRPSPQGGYDVTIDGVEHYVEPDRKLFIKVGDKVEAGDILSEGTPNPAEVAKYKGIGEARKYFVERFRKILDDSGIKAHRRNLELLARGIVNHVRITNESEGLPFLPGDLVEYDSLARRWTPRRGAETAAVGRSLVGTYLEEPVLHYTIGTRLTRSLIDKLKKQGVKMVTVHRDPPPFEPEMRRAMEAVSYSEDWMTRLAGFNLQRSLLDAAQRGATSSVTGPSYVPALARGVDFDKNMRAAQKIGE